MKLLREWLFEPSTSRYSIDDPRTTLHRRDLIRRKRFLSEIYREWYEFIAAVIPRTSGSTLELGSGGGFLNEVVPNLIRSDVFWVPNLEVVLDGQSLPFKDGSLRAIVMVDVLHHISEPRRFFQEASRCVQPGGVVAAIEPWVSPWSRFIYRTFHHEAFDPEVECWEFLSTGPLSGGNGALPWVLFVRDRKQFELEFPEWSIELLEPMMPFRYLLSGGVSIRALQPTWMTGFWRYAEQLLEPVMKEVAMFSRIVVRRREK